LRRLVKALSDLEIDWQITVAVNGTTDDTLQRVGEFLAPKADPAAYTLNEGGKIPNSKFQIQVLECPETGKAAAIKFAAQNSQADIFGFIDADLSADPETILPMVKIILANQADVVIGSRLMDIKTTNRGFLRTLSSQFFNLMSRLLLGLKVKDAQCGLKIMNAKAKKSLLACQEKGWFLDIEFLAKAVQDGLSVTEIPVPWIEFRYAGRKSQVSMLKDGWGALRAMLRIRSRQRKYV